MTCDKEDDHVVAVFSVGHTRLLKHVRQHVVALVFLLRLEETLEGSDKLVDGLNSFDPRNDLFERGKDKVDWVCDAFHDMVVLHHEGTLCVLDCVEVVTEGSSSYRVKSEAHREVVPLLDTAVAHDAEELASKGREALEGHITVQRRLDNA